MKKFLLSIFLVTLLFPAISSAAGYTTVTATVKDPNGLAYVNCAFNVSFLNQSTAPVQPLLNGSPFQQVYSGQSCDNTGAFTIVLPDNNVITPTPSKWTFSVCASNGTTCFSTSITITGTTQSITSTLQAAAVVLPLSLQTVGGTGASGQVAFWSGANSIAGDTNIFWDNTNKRLGIGLTSPSERLTVAGNTNIGFAGGAPGYVRVSEWSNYYAEFGYADAKGGSYVQGITNGANSNLLFNPGGGNVGIGNVNPNNILSLSGQANQTFWMERQLTAATPGNALTVQASGAVVGGTNLAGGALNLSGGTSTGTGASVINFQTATPGVTGAADNSPSTKVSIDGPGNMFPASAGLGALGKPSQGFQKLYVDFTNTATVGAVTINKAAGRVNIAAAGTSVVVTNSFVTAASHVFAVISTADSTATIKNVVPAAGSFTITLGAAATAQVSIDFFVVNAD